MKFSMGRSALALCTIFTGCTWIGDIRLTEKEQTLDQDGDGVSVSSGDCNDFDSTISPDLEETWYDGIDSNCDGLDDYDQDQDGFVPEEYIGLPTTGVAGSGLLPGGDCWDAKELPEENESGLTGTEIYPNAPDDLPYDGVDQDCSGESDYDVDGDGYTPNEYANLPTVGADDSLLPGGDCNDDNAAINSEQEEVWYNGVDQDCDGVNDYDQDQDNFVPDEFVGLSTEGIEGSDQLPGNDCNDEDDSVFPDAIEQYYDGTDQNCDGLDDYDKDEDGFADVLYSSESSLPALDCDDSDPDIFPGAMEILTDSRDLDCDGLGNSVGLSDIEWSSFDVLNTNTPAIVEQLTADANDNKLYVAFFQDLSIGINGAANPLAIGFDFATKTVDTFFNWATINTLYSQGIRIIIDEEMFYGGFGEYSAQNRWLHLTARNLDTGTITHRRAFINSIQTEFEDIDSHLDVDSNFHTMGCVEDGNAIGFQYAMNPSSDFFPSANNTVTATLKLEASFPEMRYSRCRFYTKNEPSSVMVGIQNNQVDLYNFTLPTDETAPQFVMDSTLDIQDVHDIQVFSQAETLTMLFTTSNTIGIYENGVEFTLKEGIIPSSVHSNMISEDLFLIGYVEEDGTAGIIHYDNSTETTTEFHFSTSFVPTEVQPWQIPETEEMVVVAIGEQNIAYGYAQYQLP